LIVPPAFRAETSACRLRRAPHGLRPARLVAIAVGVAALALGLAGGELTPADAARVYDPATVPRARYVAPLAPWPEDSYRAKDFAIHRKRGFYHVFYTRVHRHRPEHWSDGTRHVVNESTFGHAISYDLENWFEADTVLTVSRDPARWDAHHLWAPTVVEHQDTTWMLFTGVRDRQESAAPTHWSPRWQVIGAAYSTDPLLLDWVPLPEPVWSPCAESGLPGVPWAVCTPTIPGTSADFRDPFVLPPAAGSGDPWLLFYTSRPRVDQFNYVVGVAQAPGPRGPWTDLGALWDTYYPPLNSKVESPHAFRRGPDWHLLFTGDDGTTGIAWHTSQGSPLGPWTTRPPLNVFLKDAVDHPYEFALEPEAWFASEHFTLPAPSGPAEFLAVVHSYDAPAAYNAPPPADPADISIIEFRRMLWDPSGVGFVLGAPNPVRSLALDRSSARVGDPVELTLLCEGGEGRTAELSAIAYLGHESIEIEPVDLGLPAAIALGETEAVVPWTVSAGGIPPPFRLVVTVANQPLQAGVELEVQASGDPVDVAPIVRGLAGGGVRFVARGWIGGGAPAALELDLPEAAPGSIALYDVAGRHRATLADGSLPAGASTWRWDGTDLNGRPVPGGLYFARLSTPWGARTARILALR
jgi:hypothetical protein